MRRKTKLVRTHEDSDKLAKFERYNLVTLGATLGNLACGVGCLIARGYEQTGGADQGTLNITRDGMYVGFGLAVCGGVIGIMIDRHTISPDDAKKIMDKEVNKLSDALTAEAETDSRALELVRIDRTFTELATPSRPSAEDLE